MLSLYLGRKKIGLGKFITKIILTLLIVSCSTDKSLPNLGSDELVQKRTEFPDSSGYEIVSYYQDTIKHGVYEK